MFSKHWADKSIALVPLFVQCTSIRDWRSQHIWQQPNVSLQL